MNRFTRIASAAAAAILSAGIASPALAGPHGTPGSAGDRPGQHATAPVKGQKAVIKVIARLDKQLNRISTSGRIAQLAPDDKAAVQGNIAADRTALAKLGAKAKGAKTKAAVKKVRAHLKRFRVQNYSDVPDLLEYATYLLDYIEGDRADLAELVAEGDETITDPAALAALLDAAEAKVTNAAAAARAVTSLSTKSDLRAVEDALTSAESDIDAVDDIIWGA